MGTGTGTRTKNDNSPKLKGEFGCWDIPTYPNGDVLVMGKTNVRETSMQHSLLQTKLQDRTITKRSEQKKHMVMNKQ